MKDGAEGIKAIFRTQDVRYRLRVMDEVRRLFPLEAERGFEEILLQNPCLCAQYQLQVSREGNLDELDVFVELRPELSREIATEDREAIGRDVTHHIKSMIGISATVHVVDTDTIERTVVGKAKRVIDKRRAPC